MTLTRSNRWVQQGKKGGGFIAAVRITRADAVYHSSWPEGSYLVCGRPCLLLTVQGWRLEGLAGRRVQHQ
jgi:hypothetical protein